MRDRRYGVACDALLEGILEKEKGEEVVTLGGQLAKIDKAIRGWELDKQSAREQEY